MCDQLSQEQNGLLKSWLGSFSVVRDCSWPLQDTTVLHLRTPGGREYIVKASAVSHHIGREISAYQRGFPELEARVPVLAYASPEARILVAEFLPGQLVEGTSAEFEPETYLQAGMLLRRLHCPAGTSTSYMPAMIAKTRSWLDRSSGLIPESQRGRLSTELSKIRSGPVELVRTHGDYQPRNWLVDDGTIKVIDFGRADARVWVHDLIRLRHQQLQDRADLRDAFYTGLGRSLEPEDTDVWQLENLNQAIGAVVWAHQVGDGKFEESGRAMVERVLADPV